MTWINEIQRDLQSRYNINPSIVENYKTRYKHYNNRAVFYFQNDNPDIWDRPFSRFGRHDWTKASKLRIILTDKLGKDIKFRNEWYETFVYFKNLDTLIAATPKYLLESLECLELMSPLAEAAKQNFSHEYPVELSIRPRLPFDKYRYRIYTATSTKVRNSIGRENLLNMHGSLKAYDGIYMSDRFERYADRSWNPDTYFYSETLDWLPLIYMMDPRYIKRIEQFKTTEELEDNDTTA